MSWVNNIADVWLEGDKDEILFIQIERDHANPKCDICKQNEGTWLTCDYKDWKYSFHVPWAQKLGIIKDDMDDCVIDGEEPVTKYFWLKHYKAGTRLIAQGKAKELEPTTTVRQQKKKKIKKKHLEKLQQLKEKETDMEKNLKNKSHKWPPSKSSTQSTKLPERKISPVFLKAKRKSLSKNEEVSQDENSEKSSKKAISKNEAVPYKNAEIQNSPISIDSQSASNLSDDNVSKFEKNEVQNSRTIPENKLKSDSFKKEKLESADSILNDKDINLSKEAVESILPLLSFQKDFVEFECLPDSFKFNLKYRLLCEMNFLIGHKNLHSNTFLINNNWLPLEKFPRTCDLTSFNSIESSMKHGVMSYDSKNKVYFIKNSTISKIWQIDGNWGGLDQILDKLMTYIHQHKLIHSNHFSFINDPELQLVFGRQKLTQEEFMDILVNNSLEEISTKFNVKS